MLSRLLQGRAGRSLVIEVTPYQTQVLGINRPGRGPVTIEFAAEFDRHNVAALRLWLEGKKEFRKGWMSVVCGFVPRSGIVQRETLQAADLENTEQLIATIRDLQVRRTAVSSAPFQQLNAESWTFRAVNAASGTPLPPDTVKRPALLVGLANEELHEMQQHLLDCRLMPQHLEPSLLPLFGAMYQLMELRRYPRAAVIFAIRPENTAVYILGKEGVHTMGPAPLGLNSLVHQVRKEFGLENDAEAMRRLMSPDEELRLRSRKLLRGLGTALRPLLDSYEMTTGQPVGDVYCPYLPPALAWLAEPLVNVVGHEQLAIDCQEWMPAAGLQPAPGLPAFAPHWLGTLSLAGNLSETTSAAEAGTRRTPFERPWHVDCRRSIEAPGQRLVGRNFLAGAAAVILLLFTLTVTAWQAYVTRSLRADTAYWQKEMATNQGLVDELTASLTSLKSHTARVNQAHALMREPYQATEFLMNLGRVLPPRIRIDRIDANESRVVLTGSVLEPAEDASRSLGRYMDTLRRTAGIGELFSSISATSLQRENLTDTLAFEITLRLKRPTP